MTQMLKNLLENAHKYSEPNARIELLLEKMENQLHIQLTNPSSQDIVLDKKELFQAFHRGDTTAAEEGTGLGLAICQQIVQRHSGTITIRNTSDHQVFVDIYLPVQK